MVALRFATQRGCDFCRATAPHVARFAARNPTVVTTHIDVDDLRRGGGWLPRALPAFDLTVHGRSVARRTGYTTTSELEAWVAGALARAVATQRG